MRKREPTVREKSKNEVNMRKTKTPQVLKVLWAYENLNPVLISDI